MELGQKLSICWGQWGRHLSLGLPHSFYFYLCLSFSFPAFQFGLFHLPFAHSVSVIEHALRASIFSLHLSLQLLFFLLYRSAAWYSLSVFVCSPHPNSPPWISLACFHAFSYIIPVSTSLQFSFPLSLSLCWAPCRFTHSCTISLRSDMF